ncbi:hypothetical protein [Photorhabdus temperata]|uniref:YobI family P-loop NTPase n=1 Tax=Photorhabdus temperata TaxID=574560 RepID=UPI00308ACD0D
MYAGIYYLVFIAIRFFDRKIALDKVNILKAELSADKQNTTSLLNLYIDEIVYFFLKTKFRIVIFEDLDRLNNGHIYPRNFKMQFLAPENGR